METLYLGAAPVKFEWLVNVVHAAVTLWLSSFYELVKRKLFGDRRFQVGRWFRAAIPGTRIRPVVTWERPVRFQPNQ